MNTNIKIELDEDQRRQLSRNMFGINKPVTRKELNLLVGMFIEQMVEGFVDVQPKEPSVGQHAAAEVPPPPARGGAQPKEPNDFLYMRGWNAVGKVLRRMR